SGPVALRSTEKGSARLFDARVGLASWRHPHVRGAEVGESDPGEATGLIRAAPADGGGGRGETGGFVGRERELARLIDALADLSDGPHVVLVLGEAGIGKTRLVDEFSAAAWASATI